jgi:acyl carrier protein
MRIVLIVARRFKQPAEAFDRHARFREDLGADSLDLFELTCRLEEELGLVIPDHAISELRTLADVMEYLKEAGRPAA